MISLGRKGEDLVTDYYQKLGYKLVERNYIFPKGRQTGELDLILTKDNELVIVEVKTRTNTAFGTAFESVDLYKQRKLVKTAKLFIHLHPKWQAYNVRIDVAAVDIDNLQQPVIILPNAIEDLD